MDITCRAPGISAPTSPAPASAVAMVVVEGGPVPDLKGRLDELVYRRQGLPSGVPSARLQSAVGS